MPTGPQHYDRETMQLGYCLPFMVTAWLARYVPRGAGPVLDAGCGTGLSGPMVRALGYERVEGLDLSEDMLRLAAARGAYADLKQAELGQTLPWPDRYFSAFFSTGVFTEGHAPASGLDELVRITRKGGHAIVTVRDILLERLGFREEIRRARARGPLAAGRGKRAFSRLRPGEPETLIKAFVFEVL